MNAETVAVTDVPPTGGFEKLWQIRGTRLRYFSLTDLESKSYNNYANDCILHFVSIVLFDPSSLWERDFLL